MVIPRTCIFVAFRTIVPTQCRLEEVELLVHDLRAEACRRRAGLERDVVDILPRSPSQTFELCRRQGGFEDFLGEGRRIRRLAHGSPSSASQWRHVPSHAGALCTCNKLCSQPGPQAQTPRPWIPLEHGSHFHSTYYNPEARAGCRPSWRRISIEARLLAANVAAPTCFH